MKRWLAALALLPGLALAQLQPGCTEGIEDALRAINPKSAIKGDAMASDCKAWPPGNGRQTAAVMAFEQKVGADADRRWVIVLAVLDSQMRPLYSRRMEVLGDATTAVDSQSLTLDTARYFVKPGLRALGLRFRSGGNAPTAADGWSGNELMLYAPEGRTLRPVFGQPMSAQQAEICCLNRMHPGAIWDSAEMTLAVGPTAGSGWNDLVITETLTRDGNEPAKFDPTPRRQSYVYRYDGKTYRLLANPAPFWDGQCCSLGR